MNNNVYKRYYIFKAFVFFVFRRVLCVPFFVSQRTQPVTRRTQGIIQLAING